MPPVGLTRVVLLASGRVVHAHADVALRWIANGEARLADDAPETASRTGAPVPARQDGVETR